MKKHSIHAALSLAAFIVAGIDAQPLRAVSLISNTNQSGASAAFVNSGQWEAQPFRTGADPTRLESVSLYEWTYHFFEGYPIGLFSVSLYDDSNGLPDSLLPGGTLSGPSTPEGEAYQTYTTIQPLILAPNTLYWVVAKGDSSSFAGSYSWALAANTDYISPVGWSLLDYIAFSPDQGVGTERGWYSSGSTHVLAINGSIVPEPSTLALAVMGVTGLITLRRLKASR